MVCIDDIERKDKKLSITQVLGLISNLSIENNCKFILIFNEDSLSDKDLEEYRLYREKVVDLELEYSPSSTHNQSIVFDKFKHKEIVYNALSSIDLKNIRIFKHIKWNIENILKDLDGSEPEVINEILGTTAFLTYLHHEPSIKIHIEDIESLFSYKMNLTDEQKDQKKDLQSKGYRLFQDFEKQIINYICNGVYDDSKLNEEVTKLNKRQKDYNFEQDLIEVWGLYNHNFQANAEEVVKKLSSFLDKHIMNMSYREVKPMIETITEIDERIDCSTWNNRFIEHNIQSFSQNDIQYFKKTTSSENIIKQLNELEESLSKNYNLKDTIYKIVKNRSWNNEDTDFLNGNSEDQIYNWLINETDSELLSMVREVRKIFHPIESDQSNEYFGNKLHNALINLSKRSPLDRVRIKNFFKMEV